MVVKGLADPPNPAAPNAPATHSQMQTHTTIGAMTQNRTKKKTLSPIANPKFTA